MLNKQLNEEESFKTSWVMLCMAAAISKSRCGPLTSFWLLLPARCIVVVPCDICYLPSSKFERCDLFSKISDSFVAAAHTEKCPAKKRCPIP